MKNICVMKKIAMLMALMPMMTVAVADNGLVHRWSFNGDLTDSVGGITATAVGNVTTDGRQYSLAGGSYGSSYVDFGSGILPANGDGMTLEIWARRDGTRKCSRIFDIGSGTSNYLMWSWMNVDSTSDDNLSVYALCGISDVHTGVGFEQGVEYHIAVIARKTEEGYWTITFQKRNNSTGSLIASQQISSAGKSWKLSDLGQNRCWLGHSQWPSDDDAAASYNEVRIWNRALSESELAENVRLGPDVLPANVEGHEPDLPSENPVMGVVTCVTAQQRYPWNGLVDINVWLSCESNDLGGVRCAFVATNSATKLPIPIGHITRNGVDSRSGSKWIRRFIWDAEADIGAVRIDDVALTVNADILGGVQLWEGGPYWAECNVGASQPEETGYYFCWGEAVGYKRNNGWISVKDGSPFSFISGNCPTYGKSNSQLRSEGYIDSTGILVDKYDAATIHLGAPWRMPTSAEIDALISNCDTEWTNRNGVYGRLVRGRNAYASKSIFLPAAGLGSDANLNDRGSYGGYWSSTSYSDYGNAWGLRVFSSKFAVNFYQGYDYRYFGQSVRPVRGFVE